MRKSILFAAMAAAVISACTKESPVSSETPMTFTITKDAVKASLGGTSVQWTEGENISILDGDYVSDTDYHNKKFTAVSGGISTTFSGTCDDVESYYAISPYFAFQSVTNSIKYDNQYVPFRINTGTSSTLTTILPYRQKAYEGTFDPDALVMVGKSSATDKMHIDMKQLCGLVKFTLAGTDVKEIEFSGNNGENLCGPVIVEFDSDGNPVLDTDNSYTDSGFGKELFLRHVTLLPSSGNTIASGTYYISLPPTNFTQGIKMVIKKNDGTIAEKTGSTAINLTRAGIFDLGTVDCSTLTWYKAIEMPFYYYPRQTKWKMPLSSATAAVASPVTSGWYSITSWPSSQSSDNWNEGGTWYKAWLNQDKEVKVKSVPWLSDGYTFIIRATKSVSPHEINGLRITSASGNLLTFPGIEGMKLVKVAVTCGADSKKMSIVGGDGTVTDGGSEITTQMGEEHCFNLTATTAGESCKIKSGNLCLRTITLYYSE